MTIDINELRQLAQAATPGPDGISLSWVRLLRDFQQGASPAAITEILNRLEAAEKERDAARKCADMLALALNTSNHERDTLRAALQHETDCVEAAKAEIAALRAKIEAMERQEPVAWLHETRRDSDVVTNAVKCVWQRARPMSLASYTIPLYLAPGAQPAPTIAEQEQINAEAKRARKAAKRAQLEAKP